MSLTKQDLDQVRDVVLDVVMGAIDKVIEPRFESLEARFDGLETRMDGLDTRMLRQEESSRETNRRLSAVETKLDDALGRLEALENDIKEIYGMLAGLQGRAFTDPKFKALSPEQRLLTCHAELVNLAKQLKVKLPSR